MITWNVLRAAGIGAYLMLWASVVWGLVSTTSVFGRKASKATTVALHQAFSTSGLLLLATHLFFLLKDRFMPFTLLDFIIPMRATYRPVGVVLGIGSMFVMLLGVLSTSWGRKLIGTKWWRRTHSLSVPAFALALVHGLMTGTDSRRPTMFWMYVATAGILLFLLLMRGFTAGERPQRAKLPEGVVRKAPVAVAVAVTQEAAAPVPVRQLERVMPAEAEPILVRTEAEPIPIHAEAEPIPIHAEAESIAFRAEPELVEEAVGGEPAQSPHRRRSPFAVRPIPVVVVQAEVPAAPFRLESDAADADELLSEIEGDQPVLEENPNGAAASFGAAAGAGGRRTAGGNGRPPANAHADPVRRGSRRGHAPRPHPTMRSPDHPAP